jgi:hypothetical protein
VQNVLQRLDFAIFVNVSVFSSLILASTIFAYNCSSASIRIFFLIVGNCRNDMLRRPPSTIAEDISGITTAEMKNESIYVSISCMPNCIFVLIHYDKG